MFRLRFQQKPDSSQPKPGRSKLEGQMVHNIVDATSWFSCPSLITTTNYHRNFGSPGSSRISSRAAIAAQASPANLDTKQMTHNTSRIGFAEQAEKYNNVDAATIT